MKLIRVNTSNAIYYSEDFIQGFECGAKRQLEADIESAPTIGGWIPVKERLPKEYTMVLACWHDIRRGRKDQYSIIASWVEHGQWRSSAGFIYRKVTAWMPLPTPYKEGTDE